MSVYDPLRCCTMVKEFLLLKTFPFVHILNTEHSVCVRVCVWTDPWLVALPFLSKYLQSQLKNVQRTWSSHKFCVKKNCKFVCESFVILQTSLLRLSCCCLWTLSHKLSIHLFHFYCKLLSLAHSEYKTALSFCCLYTHIHYRRFTTSLCVFYLSGYLDVLHQNEGGFVS